MATTLRKISEQVQRLYARTVDQENLRPTIAWNEVKHLIVQSINTRLSVVPKDYKGVTDVPLTDVVTSAMIATYRYQSVLQEGTAYYTKLPAFPIRLPHDIGVYGVIPEGSYTGSFIPIPPSMWDLVGSLTEAGLDDQVGFYVEGDKIYYTKDPAVSQVKVKLLIVDIDSLGSDDILPVNGDLEKVVIEDVLTLLHPPQKVEKDIQPEPPSKENKG